MSVLFDIRHVKLRQAVHSDLEKIVQLIFEDDLGSKRECYKRPLPLGYEAAFAEIQSDPRSQLLVADFQGKVVGTFQITFITYLTYGGRTVAQLEAVHVDKEYRSQKVGEFMMKWAIDEARNRQCHRIQLTTNKLRSRAHRFYERIGFKPTHEGMKLILENESG